MENKKWEGTEKHDARKNVHEPFCIMPDGSAFYGSDKQAHKLGLSWSKDGVYSCCDSVRLNTSYSFPLEPDNPFDSKAVQVDIGIVEEALQLCRRLTSLTK